MSARSVAATAELTAAASLLRQNAGGSPLSLAAASLLEAQAVYWRGWFPAEPTSRDVATAQLAKAVIATYAAPPQAPEADAGNRQHNETKEEEAHGNVRPE